jgi:AcrR family transcriptional regulator
VLGVDVRRTRRGTERCEDILALARAALIEEGLERFSVRRIAERGGMTIGNLQHYFATRDDLIECLVREEFEGDLAAFGRGEGTPEDELGDLIERLSSRWSSGGSSVYEPLFLLALHEPRFAALRTEIYERFYADLAGLVREIDPDASPAECRFRAMLITGLIDGVAAQREPLIGPRLRRRALAELRRLAAGIARGD